MNRSVHIFIAALFLAALVSTPALGAMIHVTSDLTGTSTVLHANALTPSTFYVVADHFATGEMLYGFEFSLDITPGDWTIASAVFEGDHPINVGTSLNAIIGLGSPLTLSPEPVLLATYSISFTADNSDLMITLSPSDPSIVLPPEPNYWIQNDKINSFTYSSDLLINQQQFATPDLYPPGHSPVPEPATFILLGSGLAGLAFYRRKRK